MRIRGVLVAFGAVVSLWPGSALAGPLFPTPISSVGWGPASMVATDLDFDGRLDLLIANTNSNDLSILHGLPDGGLGPDTRLAAGNRPFVLIPGRFNSDSRPDFALIFSPPNDYNQVRVLSGQADGTLVPGPAQRMERGELAWTAAGDLNGDGLDDLVVPDRTFPYGLARLYFNQGTGTFSGPIDLATVPIPNGATTGDFDEDGRTDIVIGANGQVAWHRGLGGGAFAPPVTTAVGVYNRVFAVTDLNGDGHLDLAIPNGTDFPAPGQPRNFVNVLLGDGHGAFSVLGLLPARNWITTMVSGDLDGDGNPDLVLAESEGVQFTLGGMEVMKGRGDGTFGTATWYGAGSGVPSVAVGDFDLDGHADVAVVILGVATNLNLVRVDGAAIFQNLGDGAFDQPRYGSTPGGLHPGDYDADGHDDFALLDGDDGVNILLGRGDGGFDEGPRSQAGLFSWAMATGDLNGDGLLDAAVSGGSSQDVVTVLLGTGGGHFGAPHEYPGGEKHRAIALADITRDGALDILVTNDNSNFSVLPNLGDGTFGSHSRYGVHGPYQRLTILDWNDDGLSDVVADGDVLLGMANGELAPGVPLSVPTLPPGFFGGAYDFLDVDGDGEEDLLVQDQSHYSMLVERGLHGGGFAPAVEVFSTCVGAISPVAADFDGDGARDLAVVCRSLDIAVHHGTADGRFPAFERFAADGPFGLVGGDFDENGLPDLAYSSQHASAGILLNQGISNRPPVARAGQDATLECASPEGAPAVLDGTGSSDPDSTPGTNDDIVLYDWFEHFGSSDETSLGTGATRSVTLPLGSHVVTLRVTDSAGRISTDDVALQIVDTTPPVAGVSLLPAVLWPPNHRLVPVDANVAAVDLCGPATLTLVSVSSSEPDDAAGGGDGATVGDIQDVSPGTPDSSFLLRAERASAGGGRTYTVVYSATDASGNSSGATATASVPQSVNGAVEPLILHLDETAQGTRVRWDAVPGALWYDVARAPIAVLQGSPGGGAPVCLASHLTTLDTSGVEDADVPGIMEAWAYFVQSFHPEPSGYGTEPSPQDLSVAIPSLLCP